MPRVPYPLVPFPVSLHGRIADVSSLWGVGTAAQILASELWVAVGQDLRLQASLSLYLAGAGATAAPQASVLDGPDPCRHGIYNLSEK